MMVESQEFRGKRSKRLALAARARLASQSASDRKWPQSDGRSRWRRSDQHLSACALSLSLSLIVVIV